MTTTAQSVALTEAHRQAQLRNAAIVALVIKTLFGEVVDPANLVATATRWLNAVTPLLFRYRANSASMSRLYLTALRQLELPGSDEFIPTPLDPVQFDALSTSMWVTGIAGNGQNGSPLGLEKRLVKVSGLDLDPAVERAMIADSVNKAAQQAAVAATRHATAGGRDQVVAAVKEDRRAVGYLRITDGDPCFFCAMLASRGFVYKEDSFKYSNYMFDGEGVAKAHDGCQCSMKATYSRDDSLPDRSQEWQDLWKTSTSRLSGPEAVKAFRKAYGASKSSRLAASA